MRDKFGHSVLAELAVNKIRVDRQLSGRDEDSGQFVPRRECHIIDSIKNQEELELLRTVYRESLYVVGVFAPVELRTKSLEGQGLSGPEIAELMDRDSGEELAGGQTVAETFPQCDFFLRMDSNTDTQLRSRVERFLHLILGTKIITPTRSETAKLLIISNSMKNKLITTLGNGLLVIDKYIIFAATRGHYAARYCDEFEYAHEECIEGYGGARSELARAPARPDPTIFR